MKVMLDDMIATWVARYCVVTASLLMLIGEYFGGNGIEEMELCIEND